MERSRSAPHLRHRSSDRVFPAHEQDRLRLQVALPRPVRRKPRGGRSALALRFADLDALVVVGKAARPSWIAVGSRHLEIKEISYIWGKDVFETGKMLRGLVQGGGGHRSILRIGPAGENGSAMAAINVDTYRHFGRLGGGAVMGNKNLKAIVINGDASFPLPDSKDYAKIFQEVYTKLTGYGHDEQVPRHRYADQHGGAERGEDAAHP